MGFSLPMGLMAIGDAQKLQQQQILDRQRQQQIDNVLANSQAQRAAMAYSLQQRQAMDKGAALNAYYAAQGNTNQPPAPAPGTPSVRQAPPQQVPVPGATAAPPSVPPNMPQAPVSAKPLPTPKEVAAPSTPYDNVIATLDKTQQLLQTPIAQRIAADPGVRAVQAQMHTLAAQIPDPENMTDVQRAQFADLQNKMAAASKAAGMQILGMNRDATQLAMDYTRAFSVNAMAQARVASSAARDQAMLEIAMQRQARGGGGSGLFSGGNPEWQQQNLATYVKVYGHVPTAFTLRSLGSINPDVFRQAATAGVGNVGVSKSIQQQTVALKNIEANFDTLDRNYSQVLKPLVDKVNGNVALANKKLGVLIAAGNPDAHALMQALNSIRPEAAQLLQSGGAKLGATTVHALEEVEKGLPNTITPRQLAAAFQVIQSEGRNRLAALKSEIDKSQQQISDSVNGKAAGDSPHVGDIQDGYRFKGGDPSKPSSWAKVQ